MDWQTTSPYLLTLPPGAKRTRNAALYPPKNARPFMLSNPLVFQSGPAQDVGVLQIDVPIGTVAIVNRISFKCHPQFPGIFPQAWFSVLTNGIAIANGTQQIFADYTQDRSAFFYRPPQFRRVQWSAQGPTLLRLSFTVPPGNGNSFYLYCVMQGFTYYADGESPT